MSDPFTLVGKTPIVQLANFAPQTKLFAKLEYFNPLASVKDRTALGMLTAAEKNGQIKAGSLIVEPTSGNTGIALAWLARRKNYRLKLVMPESMSLERRQILRFLGAELVLTPKEQGMKGAVAKAHEISETEKAFFPNQFANSANPEFHAKTTGPEIWKALKSKVDYAVFGVGTGGTLTGAGGFLKKQNPHLQLVAVEPEESPILTNALNPQQKPRAIGPHKIQGIGAGFVPKILKTALIDAVETVESTVAIKATQELAQKEGLFAGISSGAAAVAARRVAQKNPNKIVVTVFPDTAERYLSTDLFKSLQN